MPHTYFITGASRGFGRDLVETLIERGHKVVASARSIASLVYAEKLGAATVQWDVTSPPAQLKVQGQDVIAKYGPIDVLINNAGYVHEGTIEEGTPEAIKAQFDTNLFGLIYTTQAFLPHFRQRKTGVIVNIGSIAGWEPSPGVGYYCTTKAAVRMLTANLREEVAPFGIRCFCIEPGRFRTDFLKPEGGTRVSQRDNRIADYDEFAVNLNNRLNSGHNTQPGDPKKGAGLIVDAVEGTGAAAGYEIPFHIGLGSDAYDAIRKNAQISIDFVEQTREFTRGANVDL